MCISFATGDWGDRGMRCVIGAASPAPFQRVLAVCCHNGFGCGRTLLWQTLCSGNCAQWRQRGPSDCAVLNSVGHRGLNTDKAEVRLRGARPIYDFVALNATLRRSIALRHTYLSQASLQLNWVAHPSRAPTNGRRQIIVGRPRAIQSVRCFIGQLRSALGVSNADLRRSGKPVFA